MILETERISLRLLTMDDLDAMAEILGDREVMRFSLSGPYDREKTRNFLELTQSHYDKYGTGLMAVVHKGEQRVIGYCGIVFQHIDGENLPEIGYRLHPQFWGKGLATEAAMAVQEYGFNEMKYDKMISIIESENVGSIRVAEKNGLTLEKETIFKDKVPVRIYSICSM